MIDTDFRAATDRPCTLDRLPKPTVPTPALRKEDPPMAGRRQTTGRPRQDLLRAQRRLAHLQAELAGATTHADRVVAAADFLRGALKHADPRTADAVADEVVQQLTAAGTRLLAPKEDVA